MPKAKSTCSIDGCERGGRVIRGWCEMHYRRWRSHGDPNHPSVSAPIAERFWQLASVTDRMFDGEPCWAWGNVPGTNGYGRTQVNGKRWLAHRVAYDLLVGPIPKGLTIDHLCRNTWCVNPAHLEAVTLRVNNLRGGNAAAVNARKTHCKRGHPFDKENTHIAVGGGRVCRTCRRDYQRARYLASKAARQ
jgi:hypothetical protein